jgi:hypothetical protein
MQRGHGGVPSRAELRAAPHLVVDDEAVGFASGTHVSPLVDDMDILDAKDHQTHDPNTNLMRPTPR